MKNFFFRKKNIFINNGFSTRKNSNENEINYKYIRRKYNLDSAKKIKYSLSYKNVANLILTSRQTSVHNKKSVNSSSNEYDSNSTNKQNLKLKPVYKKKLFENKELCKYTFDLLDNKNNFNNTKEFKKTINRSSQSDCNCLDDGQEDKLKLEHYFKIDKLLNKKMEINKNPRKLRKINFNFNQEKTTFINNLIKSNYNGIFSKNFEMKQKPLKYYFNFSENKNKGNNIDNKINIPSLSLNDKTRNNKSLILQKVDSFEDKSIYDIVNIRNKKVYYANKLIIDDNLSKNSNVDNFSLKKGKGNIISNFSIMYGNKNILKANKIKYNSMNIKNKHAKKIKFISFDKMKLLSKKGYENLMNRKFGNISQQIHDVVGVIEKNKKNFRNIMEINAQIYNKNKKAVLNEDDDEDLF